jgi:hypothetical protein
MRRTALVLTALAALAAAPGAAAWTTLSGGVSSAVIPSTIITQAGTELVSFDSPTAGTISVARNGVAKAIVTGDPSAELTQLVQQPNGAIQLYFPNASGVGRMTSTDDGNTWTGPIQTLSHSVGAIEAVATMPDGTPLFVQTATGIVNVFRGLNGETVKNVYTRCCASYPSLAVDSAGLAQIAFYSNADPDAATAYIALAADLSPLTPILLKPVGLHEAPLVSDHSGNTFLAWAPGYPIATALSIVPLRGGQPAGDGVTIHAKFSGDADPHMALSVDQQDRLWVAWTTPGALHVARSRTHGMDFGAVVSVAVPAVTHTISAVGIPGNPGKIDVIVNTGTSLIEQSLPPGLSVKLAKAAKKVGKKTVVTWTAQALDDGVPVPTATFTVGGHTVHANSSGKAKVGPGSGKAAAPGYAAASFKVH